ncbi:unnamed protein product [Cyprideis torosa]|uniref:Uncharacterized protein n=1 Tax=Cyprideis torosa TaxID=163714 RepID=A0A7R8WNI8_9CRUS|nr:unnamed protein product [Cyprideis torosa]CAG0906368.1 unnamed protein product [Cyprideis torosa]
MVESLTKYSDMTFMISEVTWLEKFWKASDVGVRNQLRALLESKRLEVTTGGWIMPDEASTTLYPLIDCLVEGHEWLRHHLNVTPEYGWSIDIFGHGMTMPYLLNQSGIHASVIQRIHFAFKYWMAVHQYGDFWWRQTWDQAGKYDLLTHNMPFDIYTIDMNCGPDRRICRRFDFRNSGDLSANDLPRMAGDYVAQVRRVASLFPYNVVFVPVGEDFRFVKRSEWDNQYRNYHALISHINKHKDEYQAEARFGTLRDYFHAIQPFSDKWISMKGDFFVYR